MNRALTLSVWCSAFLSGQYQTKPSPDGALQKRTSAGSLLSASQQQSKTSILGWCSGSTQHSQFPRSSKQTCDKGTKGHMNPLYLVREVRHTKQQLVFIYPIKVNTEAHDTLLRSLFEKTNIWLLLKGITQQKKIPQNSVNRITTKTLTLSFHLLYLCLELMDSWNYLLKYLWREKKSSNICESIICRRQIMAIQGHQFGNVLQFASGVLKNRKSFGKYTFIFKEFLAISA